MDIKKYLTLFDSDSDYEDFYGDESKGYNFPNVSYTKNDKHTHYEPIDYITGLTLNKSSVTLKKGDTDQLTASIVPSTATMPNVVWKSSRSKVVSVTQDGLITALGLSGDCIIYAIAADGSGVSAQCEVTVEYVPVTAITLNKNIVNIEVNGTYQLEATVEPSNATIKDVIWTSSDASVVSVDSTGLLKAEAMTGDVIVTATTVDGGYTATCAVHIDYRPVTGITLDKDYIEFVPTGESAQTLVATVLPIDASIQDVTWESSDESIATVDENGVVTPTDIENVTGSCIITVTTVEGGYTAQCEVKVKPDYSTEYFTVVPLTRTQDNVVLGMGNPAGVFSASTDDGVTWVEWDPSQGGITIPKDCVLKLKGTVTPTAANGIGTFYPPTLMTFRVEGNPMSLLYGDDFRGQDDLSGKDYAFYKLFQDNQKLIDAEDLVLLADTLSDFCYGSMFHYCTNLERIPNVLLATKAASGSCYSMFASCTKITKTPKLSITDFSEGNRCYNAMFSGCTALTSITSSIGDSASTMPASGCTGMFAGCTSLSTVPNTLLPATTLGSECYRDMFKGCTSLTSGPVLPATIINSGSASKCYVGMYSGCTLLNEITCMLTSGITTAMCQNWGAGVAPTGTFYRYKGATDWVIDSVHGIPPGWTVVDVNIEINKESTALSTGETEQLFATITPLRLSQDVVWSSSDDTIATVDENGNVTAVGTGGTVMISATSVVYGISAVCKIGVNMEGTYFTIVANEASNINVYPTLRAKLSATTDGTSWTELPTGTTTTYNLSPNDKLMFKGGWSGGWTTSGICSFSGSTGNFEAEGNVMSLVSKDSFSGDTDMSNKRVANLFYRTSGLTNASMMVLPATTLEERCYYNMFYDCPNLKHAPKMAAATLKVSCYQYMFSGCKSMVDTPTLPATTLEENCYYGMFMNCSGLTKTPELPATTLAEGCYAYMFSYCYGLTEAPELPATTLAESCYEGMFISCRVFTELPELPATTLAAKCYERMFEQCSGITSMDTNYLPVTNLETACYKGMFGNCKSLTNLPKLSATILADSCYQEMFNGCTSLTSVPSDYLQSTQLGNASYAKMFSGCTNITSVPELPATVMTASAYTGMFGGCSSLTSIPTDYLPSTQLASCCYQEMFRGCSGLTSIQTDLLKATTLANNCYEGMFSNCSHITNAPDLVATTLAPSCYNSMFNGCSGLTEFTSVLSSDTMPANACQYMFQNCVNLETVPANMLPATTISPYCYNAMFKYCYKLSTMMILPSPNLETFCYKEMFYIRDYSGTIRGNLSGLICLCMPSVPNTTQSPIYGMLTYQKKDSSTLYIASGTQTNWQHELQPGGWIPNEWSIEVYNP